MPRDELKERIELIEESYEFMLAYAAKGLPADTGSAAGVELRDYLKRSDEAMTQLVGLVQARVSERVSQGDQEASVPYDAFISVLATDAANAQAALRLVLVQPSISSQLIDNLNASIHLRALLTDLFLIDEILNPTSS